MVASVTNLGRSGLYDWVVQRLTAVILALYTLFLLGFVIASPGRRARALVRVERASGSPGQRPPH